MSDSAPNSGSMNSANMLSADMITPATVSLTSKVFFSINGMIKSYSCQKAEMVRKASPTSMVLG